ncbi:MAG: tetratricopeptide repeat protein, partial [Saprospiraceae bacterium]|nr:tetratricopeptide repeat protein [Saprospiraceae bacterium]
KRFARKPAKAWEQSLFTPHYKPLVLLSWVAESKLFGLKSNVLHFNNLLLHTINAILVFFITLKLAARFNMTRKQPELVAVFTGLLFAVHPLHVESVAWAIERKDVMYAGFFLLGLLAYLRYLKSPSVKWMGLAALCYILSILSKAPAIIFPFVLLLFDYTYRRKVELKRVTEKWPVFAMMFLGLFLFGFFGGEPPGGGGGTGAAEGGLTNLVSAAPVSDVHPLRVLPAFYAKIALLGVKGVGWYFHSWLPVNLSLAYPYKTILPAIGHLIHLFPLLLGVGAFFVLKWRDKYPLLLFTHGFFFLALAPALIRTGLGKGIFLSDRYVYVALFGLMLFIAAHVLNWTRKKGWNRQRQFLVMGAIVLLLGTLSFRQASVWDNGETLWTNVIDKYPNIAYAHVNRGIYRNDHGDVAGALEDFNIAAELGDDPHAFIHRGTLLRKQGQTQQALADFERLLATEPRNEHAINGKANVLFEMGRYREAEEVYTQGLGVKPGMVTYYVNRAAARYYLGKYQEALADLDKAESMRRNYGGIHSKRTVILMAMQDYANAVISAQKTAQVEPNNHANLGDLGTALQRLGRHQEAIDAFTRALQIYDRGKRYYNGRALSYEALGNTAQAQRDRQIASTL